MVRYGVRVLSSYKRNEGENSCTMGLALPHGTLANRALPTADAMTAVYGSRWAGRLLVMGGLLGIVTSWTRSSSGRSACCLLWPGAACCQRFFRACIYATSHLWR